MITDGTLYCDFCGKSQKEVAKLIAGPSAMICDECVLLAVEVIFDHAREHLRTVKVEDAS